MYSKCGSIEDACKVFNNMPSRDVVTWNAMISGHVKCGQGQKALELFHQMQQKGVQPTPVTLMGVLNACASMFALQEGRRTHEQIIESGWESDVFVGSSLVDMYAKCGSIEDAKRVFNKLPSRDVVSWNVMILGHVKCGQGQKALELFQQMQQEGVQSDPVTLVGVLNACASVVALEEGRRAHDWVIKSGWDSIVFVGNSLIDMYAKCGSLEDALKVFNKMPSRDVVTWNAMIGGYAIHGHGKEALKQFEQMREEGVQPDDTTFGCLLSACSHSEFMAMWRMGERVAKQVLELEPENAAGYVLLSNLYTATGNRDLSENIEQQRKERSVKKHPGRTWIEVDNEVHTFVVDDQHHPQMIEIHAELKKLSGLMHDAGYVPDTNFVLHDVEEEEKVFHLCHHSEKLAIAFGLINSAPGIPLCIRKNLWVCCDCHTSTKFISKVVGRAIMVRDANRFHHFQDGECSCRDYW
ncbi:unnamed protein product [Sphagnum jensenii]|uniref:DYW domain-containing protein n=1 Tax=Sphagnum jensenii TaxID=128206 RepID=A0ABP1C1T1_9BRYO